MGGKWVLCVYMWVFVCGCGAVEDLLSKVTPVTGPRILDMPLPTNKTEEETRRIINGQKANLGDVPYLVSFRVLRAKSYYVAFCGGSLIKPKVVVSAAHCFEMFTSYMTKFFKRCKKNIHLNRSEVAKVRAVAGTVTNVESLNYPESPKTTQWRYLAGVWYPSSYRFPVDDISIVKLTKPFAITAYVRAIPYAQVVQQYYGTCLAAGFGRTNYNSAVPTKYLYMANLEILLQNVCGGVFKKNMRDFICTETNKNDVAQGDSGGPLVCSGTREKGEGPMGLLVGATSAGTTTKTGGKLYRLSLFTRLASHRAFLQRNAAPPARRPFLLAGTLTLLMACS